MKQKALLALIFFCLSNKLFAQQNLVKTISSGGVTRTYKIYIPAMYSSSNAVPLLFNFHGYGSNHTEQEFYANFRPIADTANFIIVHPLGTLLLGSAGWNNFGALNSAPDDLLFVSDMIDTIKANYNINSNKIYSTGFSNGSFMSYDLACFMNAKFAAIASVAGSMVETHINGCTQAMHPTPILHIHGDADPTITPSGTGGLIIATPIDSLVKFWVQKNNCNPIPQINNIANTNTTDGCTAEQHIYTGGDRGSSVEFYKIIGGEHTWPFAPVTTGITNRDINACKEIWRFLNQYSLDSLQYPLNTANVNKSPFSIYPNPSEGKIFIQSEEHSLLEVFDLIGNKVFFIKLENNINSIDLSHLPKGQYFYKIQNLENKAGKLLLK